MAMKFKDTGDGYKRLVVGDKRAYDPDKLCVETLISGEPGLLFYVEGDNGSVELTRKQSIKLALAILREMTSAD